jgi:hypothetical protein
MSELFDFDALRKFFQTGFRMVFERRIRFNPVHADISNRDLHYRFQLDLTAKVTAAGSAADDSPARRRAGGLAGAGVCAGGGSAQWAAIRAGAGVSGVSRRRVGRPRSGYRTA